MIQIPKEIWGVCRSTDFIKPRLYKIDSVSITTNSNLKGVEHRIHVHLVGGNSFYYDEGADEVEHHPSHDKYAIQNFPEDFSYNREDVVKYIEKLYDEKIDKALKEIEKLQRFKRNLQIN